jgi:hypothetical protein
MNCGFVASQRLKNHRLFFIGDTISPPFGAGMGWEIAGALLGNGAGPGRVGAVGPFPVAL